MKKRKVVASLASGKSGPGPPHASVKKQKVDKIHDKELMIPEGKEEKRPPKRKKKGLQAGEEMFTIKQGLLKLVKVKELIEPICKLAESVSYWTYHAHNLIHLHVLSLLEAGEPFKFGQTDVDHAFQLVSGCSCSGAEITETYKKLFRRHQIKFKLPTDRSGPAVQACKFARREFLTAAKNNVFVHFETRHKNWLNLQLRWYFTEVREELPSKKAMWQLTNWLYKATTWKKESADKLIPWFEDPKRHKVVFQNEKAIQKRCARIIKQARQGILNLPLSDKKMQINWTHYLPWMRRMLTDFTDQQARVQLLVDAEKKRWEEKESKKAVPESKDVKAPATEEEKQRTKLQNKALQKIRKDLRGCRLFSLIPQAKLGIRHIQIDNTVLFYLFRQCNSLCDGITVSKFIQENEKWWDLAFRHHDEVKHRPYYCIKTDGVAASAVYVRKKAAKSPPIGNVLHAEIQEKKAEADQGEGKEEKRAPEKKKRSCQKRKGVSSIEDEIDPLFVPLKDLSAQTRVIGLDPGKRAIFSTSEGWSLFKHERKQTRMSSGEYGHLSGNTQRRRRAAKWNKKLKEQLGDLFVNTQVSAKVTSVVAYLVFLTADAQTFLARWIFRKRKRERRLKFDKYIRGIQAIDKACHRIIGDHRAPVVIAFGSARFNGTKGFISAPTKRLHARLSTVHRQCCTVVDVDEFRTSKMCHTCGSKLFNVWRPDVTPEEKKQKQKSFQSLIYSLKACQKCKSVLDRDDLGAFNIALAFRQLNHNGTRPPHLQRRNPAGQGRLLAVHRKHQLYWNPLY